VPRQSKLRKKKTGKPAYWFTKPGGDTYFGNVKVVPVKEVRRRFRDHVKNLLESEQASKGRALTASQLMKLFLDAESTPVRSRAGGMYWLAIDP
jgi:hypothetical protein